MKKILSVVLFGALFIAACGSAEKPAETKNTLTAAAQESGATGSHWKGNFSNGLKGAKLSFNIKKGEVKELTFQGYWRCDGKLELTTLGPKKGFPLKGNSVDGIVKESGFYFELHGTVSGNKASGTLRIAFTAGGCDTYKLNWTAEKE
ncbi:hypothetical protein [Flavisolibacter ginsenosidimutans]|uniref:Lipoprotein n=1 Tax=Flavisolibacter ginsenosidimutans TaxID=661481 RepID=A0A5B8UK66_9BACT|nr:hypothetical protein [Flavisolibacter ginsenosidimutans]QEC57081.1 hypothetical protein FSB75_14615 [Flavisolibacter ginsenosidimutans]